MKQPTSTVVVVAGRLGATDMGRLEHACAPALVTQTPDLVVDIQAVTEIDGVAQAHLSRIESRGAIIRRVS